MADESTRLTKGAEPLWTYASIGGKELDFKLSDTELGALTREANWGSVALRADSAMADVALVVLMLCRSISSSSDSPS
jgi:hypothetical protein